VGQYPSCHPTNSVKALKANEKLEYNKSKHASTTKYTKHKNKHKKLKPGLVALCNNQPGNGMAYSPKIGKQRGK